MDIAELVGEGKEQIYDPSYPTVDAWKEQHPERSVIGCFQVYTPQELVCAYGMLPVGVMGGCGAVETDHADALIQSFVCSICRSTLELGLTGRLSKFDGVIFPSICDVARNLSGVFQRNFADLMVEYLHLPQNMSSRGAADYLKKEYLRLAKRLERLSGLHLSSAELRNSIVIFNENRHLLNQLYETRCDKPWQISAAETYVVARLGSIMPKEEHSALLRAVLEELPRRSIRPRDKVRVVIEGAFCEQPPLEFLETTEEAGCYVVDDDLLIGSRWFHEDILVNGDPLAALAESYLRQSVTSSVRHQPTSRTEAFIRKVRKAKAGGVIFATPKFCEPALDDFVLYRNALEREGLPYLCIEFEEKMAAFESVRSQVETFVESILFD